MKTFKTEATTECTVKTLRRIKRQEISSESAVACQAKPRPLVPDSGVDPRLIITSPSQLCGQDPCFGADIDRISCVSREYVHPRRIIPIHDSRDPWGIERRGESARVTAARKASSTGLSLATQPALAHSIAYTAINLFENSIWQFGYF